MKKKLLTLFMCIGLILSFKPISALALDVTSDDIVILYTNDIHSYICNDDGTALSYDSVAALKKYYLSKTDNVLLVDAGDHIQGTAYGALDSGKSIIKFMNEADYDLATLGNHEFDYMMPGMLATVEAADFPYVSCNFKNLETNSMVLDSYKIFDFGDTQVAFIGITTPETFTSTSPAYFQDNNGNYLYDILGGSDGSLLYASVQSAIDEVTVLGADYIIALGHLGVNESSDVWTSKAVIENTAGLDAFIDGHSHTAVPIEYVSDRLGNTVVLTQTGEYFENIGMLSISKDGSIKTELINNYTEKDSVVSASIQAWADEVDRQLGSKIADSEIDFSIEDSDGNRLVRIRETNMGAFVADAYYYLINETDGIGCDVTLINGGGVRANALKGEWTYKTMKDVNPFGNVICIIELTGQQLIDLIEWTSRNTTGVPGCPEEGSFFHTAGLSYEVDTSVTSTTSGIDGIWESAPTGEYRIKNVRIYNKATGYYEPIEQEKEYTLAGSNYTLRNSMDELGMLTDSVLIKDYIMEDYMALAEYAKAFKDTDNDGFANINSKNSPLAAYDGYLINYEDIYGTGRINIHSGNPCEKGHILQHLNLIEATEDSEGRLEHYYCIACDKYFSADQEQTEITKDILVIEKLSDGNIDPEQSPFVLFAIVIAASVVIGFVMLKMKRK